MLSDFDRGQDRSSEIEPQKPSTIARSLAIGNPADGHYAIKVIKNSGGWSEDVSDPEVIDSIKLLAETEGVFTETAGGVTVGMRRQAVSPGSHPAGGDDCALHHRQRTEDDRRARRRLQDRTADRSEADGVRSATCSRRSACAEIPGVIAEAKAVGA